MKTIKDSGLGVDIETAFVKHWPGFSDAQDPVSATSGAAPKGGGDWALRIKVTAGQDSSKRARRSSKHTAVPDAVSVVVNVCTLGGKKAVLSNPEAVGGGGGEGKGLSFLGWNSATGKFGVSVVARAGVAGEEGGVQARYYGGKHRRDHMEQADDLLKNVYGYAQHKAAEEGRVGEESELRLPDEVHDEHAANTMFVQLRVPVGGQVDVVLTSLSAHGIDAKQPTHKLNKALTQAVHGLTGARLDALLATRLEAFRAKFDRVFRLADRTCTPASGKHAVACNGGGFSADAIETGMVALSQVLGGMTYLDGTWFKATKPFYNNSVEQPAVVSFTASPCRDGFARGFLWDEGFHQLLVARWDAGLSRDVLLHWLALLQSDGWIPREQVCERAGGTRAAGELPTSYALSGRVTH